MKRTISLCLVVVILMMTLASCGLSKSELVGTWSGSWTYEGNSISCAIVFGDSGTYAKVTYRNGSPSSSETGDYEIKGNKVILYDSSSSVYHGNSTTYKVKGGQLENNGHFLSKK